MAISLDLGNPRSMDEIARSSISDLPFRQRDNDSLSTMEERLTKYIDDRASIASRLRELESEWSSERVLCGVVGTVLVGRLAGARRIGRASSWLTGIVGGFLIQQSLMSWSPPVALVQRLGFRSAHEIDNERIALKALRGDFEGTEDPSITARHILLATDPTVFH